MRILVVAEEPSKFEQWQRAQLQPGQEATNGAAAKGLALFQTSSCMNCHAIRSVAGADARVAPGPDARRQPQTTYPLGYSLFEQCRQFLDRLAHTPQTNGTPTMTQ
jgi:hypothetical protein